MVGQDQEACLGLLFFSTMLFDNVVLKKGKTKREREREREKERKKLFFFLDLVPSMATNRSCRVCACP